MDCMTHTSIRTDDAIYILHQSAHLGGGIFYWSNLLHDECMSHVYKFEGNIDGGVSLDFRAGPSMICEGPLFQRLTYHKLHRVQS